MARAGFSGSAPPVHPGAGTIDSGPAGHEIGRLTAQPTVQGNKPVIASTIESLLIAAVVVCFLAFVFVIANPEADLSASVLCRYPELTRFASADQARRALRGAWRRLRLPRLLVFVGIGLPVFASVVGLGWLLREELMKRNLLIIPEGPAAMLTWVAGGAIAGMVIQRILSRRIQRDLRDQLNLIGRSVCLVCGYSLAGNLSGICPECGNAASGRTAERPRRTEV
jgi:hypothetical protein